MIAFLDTEFTGLGQSPLLLSVGIVMGSGENREFYAEVNDPVRLEAATAFAAETVLPQFGRIDGAGCAYAELAERLLNFIVDVAPSRQSGALLTLAFNSDIDWQLVAQALHKGKGRHGSRIEAFLRPLNIYNIDGFAAGQLAADSYYAAQRSAPIHRHHALCDARALRVAYAAATASRAQLTVVDRAAAHGPKTERVADWPSTTQGMT